MTTNFNEIFHKIIEPMNDKIGLDKIEERFYFYFDEIENKIEFLNYLKNTFLPYYKDKITRNYSFPLHTIKIESNKYKFVENWLNEKIKIFIPNNDLPPQPLSKQTEPIKFNANEKALSYIFDLHANGKQIPINRAEGSYNAKELKRIGKEDYKFDKDDTFYRAVKKVLTYDLNSVKTLQNISKDWLNAVKTNSKDWAKTKQYLIEKKLIKE